MNIWDFLNWDFIGLVFGVAVALFAYFAFWWHVYTTPGHPWQ